MDFTSHDIAINGFLSALEVYQGEYIKTHPVYLQELPSHSVVPSVPTKPDRLNQKPFQKPMTWTDTGLLSAAKLPLSVEVHEYAAPGGKGWVAVFKTSDGTDTYVKTIGYGVESGNTTSDWKLMKQLQ